jgi:hypothetical protein
MYLQKVRSKIFLKKNIFFIGIFSVTSTDEKSRIQILIRKLVAWGAGPCLLSVI